MDRNKIIKTASVISISGNAVLSILKITVGLTAGSLAVFGDGLDSLTDIFISLITLVVVVIITRPPDKNHPHGHGRAETLATNILAFIMFFIGGQLALSSAGTLFSQETIRMPEPIAIYITLISIIGKILLSWSQYALGKKSGSAMLIANSKNMLNDIITSTGVLIGLGCTFLFKLPVIDKIIAILIGIWIIVSAIRIFMGTLTELMEGESDKDMYKKIFAVVKASTGVDNPHRVRIRKLGVLYSIEMDVEVDGNMRVTDAHECVTLFEENLRKAVPNIYDIVVHIEPAGNHVHEERYGLSEHNIG